jgi:uncharacterized coiled-coil DUF342 family protein
MALNLIDELEDKRHKLNREAEIHKRERDHFNSEMKKWVNKRAEVNDKLRKLIKEANGHREERDKINKDVQEAKKKREKLNAEYLKLFDEVNQLKKTQLPRKGVPQGKLKKELRKLEFRQQTSVLTKDQERDLIDSMVQIQNKIKENDMLLEKNKEIKSALDVARDAKDKAEAEHRSVNELANSAQKEHDDMIKIYSEVDKLKVEVDEAQNKLVKCKLEADEEHRNHILFIKQVHDYDKIIYALKQKQRRVKKVKDEKIAKKQAEEIFERFKSGEKLDTEDIMYLQKAGYL